MESPRSSRNGSDVNAWQGSNSTALVMEALRGAASLGAATAITEFGTPNTTTDYAFCLYDAGTLVAKIKIPAGGTCAGKPCWSAKPTSFRYQDKDLTPDGIQQLKLKAEEELKRRVNEQIEQQPGFEVILAMLGTLAAVSLRRRNR